MIQRLKVWARTVKRDAVALWFVARDPETPLAAKALTWFVAAYALSPIDLIPDFIPVIGYLDDLIIVPLGIVLVIRMVPCEVLERSRAKAEALASRPKSLAGLLFVVSIWLLVLAMLSFWLTHRK